MRIECGWWCLRGLLDVKAEEQEGVIWIDCVGLGCELGKRIGWHHLGFNRTGFEVGRGIDARI